MNELLFEKADTTRPLVQSDLTTALSKILKNAAVDKARELEAELYTAYKISPQNYFKQVARVCTFADPDNYLGCFAKFFREKLEKGTYDVGKVSALGLVDFLPEVFLNASVDVEERQKLHKMIKNGINEKIQKLVDKYSEKSCEELQLNHVTKSLENIGKQKDADDKNISYDVSFKEGATDSTVGAHAHGEGRPDTSICHNPFWDTKTANIVIVKEDGKFYCLDVEKLLVQIAQTGAAKNYITGQGVSGEIVSNLRARYSKEIAEEMNRKSGKISVGTYYTERERVDLVDALDHLRSFGTALKAEDVVEHVDKLGLAAFVDTDPGFNAFLPGQAKEMFMRVINEKGAAEAVKEMKTWVAENVNKLSKVVASFGGIVEPVVDVVVKRANMNKGVDGSFVLNPDTLSMKIIMGYLSRLENAKDTILRALKDGDGRQDDKTSADKPAGDKEKTKEESLSEQKLREELDKIRALEDKIEELSKSAAGVASLVRSTLEMNKSLYTGLMKSVDMNLAYQDPMNPVYEESIHKKQYIMDLEAELAELEK